MPHYIGFVSDPTLKDDVLVFSVRDVPDRRHAEHAILNKYEENGWPIKNVTIRLVALRSTQQVQHIGHVQAEKDVEAIRALCEEILSYASDEPIVAYGDKLRALVRAFSIGEQVYQSLYPEEEERK